MEALETHREALPGSELRKIRPPNLTRIGSALNPTKGQGLVLLSGPEKGFGRTLSFCGVSTPSP